MARKSQIAKNEERMLIARKYKERRQALLAIMNNPETGDAEREAARRTFNNIPRDASTTRIRVRCGITGRGNGCYRKFRLSRIKFRELANGGLLPGVTKSSW